jgi:hypothetical protein
MKKYYDFPIQVRDAKNQQRRKEREQNHIQQQPCKCLITISKAIKGH